MSWFFGGIGNFHKDYFSSILKIVDKPLLNHSEDKLFIAAGGNPDTCNFKIYPSNNEKKNWLIIGVGISKNNKKKFLSELDWENIVANNEEEKFDIDGHYILISWNKDKLLFITDNLGLRDFYYCNDKSGNILFSTRIDWLSKLTSLKIDFKEFGSRWLLFSQLTTNCVFNNINRITAGKCVTINKNTNEIKIKEKNWLPLFNEQHYNLQDFHEQLNELISFPLIENKLSLSLSGGLDSRLLFSLLLKNINYNWDTHSFGEPSHPDSIIAKRITSDLGIPHKQIYSPFPPLEQFMNEFLEFSGQTIGNVSVSSFIQLRHYKELKNSNQIIIDGAFGEIWRRGFFTKLSIIGSNYILEKDFNKILQYLRVNRANIFNENIIQTMINGCKEQLEILFDNLPSPHKIGIDNFIEIFAIKTKLPNYFCYEQSRLDNIIKCYMPFIQTSLLEKIFILPLTIRKNGNLFKLLLKNNNKRLTKYPLVKGDTIYPYWLNNTQMRIYNYIKNRLNRQIDESKVMLIRKLFPYIYDLVNSRTFKECDYINKKKIMFLIEQFQQKNYKNEILNELDWWITFEIMKQSLSLD